MPAPRKFIHSLQWYAQQYGISASKAKRLSLAGVNLDDPNAMSASLADKRSRNKGNNHQRTSTQLRPTVNQSDWFTVNRTEPFPNQSEPFRAELEKHIGMSSGIKRLQAVEVLLALDYEEARRSRDMKLAKACREEWLAIFEQLRRAEVANPEVEKSKGESVSVAEVVIEVHKIHSAMRTSIDAVPDRLAHKVVGFSCGPHSLRKIARLLHPI
jgi:hypothetical protein